MSASAPGNGTVELLAVDGPLGGDDAFGAGAFGCAAGFGDSFGFAGAFGFGCGTGCGVFGAVAFWPAGLLGALVAACAATSQLACRTKASNSRKTLIIRAMFKVEVAQKRRRTSQVGANR